MYVYTLSMRLCCMTDALHMHTAYKLALLSMHAGTVLAYLNIVGRPVTLKLRKAEAYNADGSLVPSSLATSTSTSTATAPPPLLGTPRNRGGSGSVQVTSILYTLMTFFYDVTCVVMLTRVSR
jgi:hypothetical protein